MKFFNKLFIPISFKLITITVIILLSVTIPIAYKSANYFEKETFENEKRTNTSLAMARSVDVDGFFISLIDKIKVTASILHNSSENNQGNENSLDLTFKKDRDLIAVEVVSKDGVQAKIVNEEYLQTYNLDKTYIDKVTELQKADGKFLTNAVFAGEIEIRNATYANGAPLLAIGVPFVKDENEMITHIARAYVRMDRLQRIFESKNERLLFLVDRDGNLIAHPDEKLVFEGKNLKNVKIVEASLKSQLKAGGKDKYFDPTQNAEFVGSFAKTALGLSVIAQASIQVILEGARQVKLQAFKITGQGLSIAIFVVFLFSISLTAPIEKLVLAAKEIAKGNFNAKSGIKSLDEVGSLASAFDHMVSGLQERDKMKTVLNKFHGSSVADNLLKGDLELGGTRKMVTVFFSDIRDFTKFSEGHSAEEVVEMLNEYFHIMVGIINKNKGVVDKFIGDAIMAVWGAPESNEDDAQNAVRACLEMRSALERLNEKRMTRGQTPIKIGMGLHTGEAISGTIGSDERMEYTVIGDTVNQASRIESSTKSFGTDLLLSDTVVENVKNQFIIEMAGKAEVKGKSKALELYKCRGLIDASGNEIIIQTAYSDYEAQDADKVKIAN